MKMKQLLILLAVLIALVAGIYGVQTYRDRPPSAEEKMFFPNLKEGDIYEITCTERDSTAGVKKMNGEWVIPKDNNFRADSSKVAACIRDFMTLEKRDLISDNLANLSVFEIDTVYSWRIHAKGADGKVLADLWIGKNSSDNSGFHVLVAGTKEVYTTTTSFKFDFSPTVLAWKDRKIFRFKHNEIAAITIKTDSGELALEKDLKGKWFITKPSYAPADSLQMFYYTTELALTETDSWNPPLPQVEIPKPVITVTVKTQNGKQFVLKAGNRQETMFDCKVDGDPNNYMIGEYRIKNMRKNFEDLVEKKPVEQAQPSPTVMPQGMQQQ